MDDIFNLETEYEKRQRLEAHKRGSIENCELGKLLKIANEKDIPVSDEGFELGVICDWTGSPKMYSVSLIDDPRDNNFYNTARKIVLGFSDMFYNKPFNAKPNVIY